MFCHCLRGVSRNTHDTYVIFLGGVKIHVIVACTAHQYQADPFLMQDRQGAGGYIGAYKGADRVKPIRQGGGSWIQVGLGIFDFYLRKSRQSS